MLTICRHQHTQPHANGLGSLPQPTNLLAGSAALELTPLDRP